MKLSQLLRLPQPSGEEHGKRRGPPLPPDDLEEVVLSGYIPRLLGNYLAGARLAGDTCPVCGVAQGASHLAVRAGVTSLSGPLLAGAD